MKKHIPFLLALFVLIAVAAHALWLSGGNEKKHHHNHGHHHDHDHTSTKDSEFELTEGVFDLSQVEEAEYLAAPQSFSNAVSNAEKEPEPIFVGSASYSKNQLHTFSEPLSVGFYYLGGLEEGDIEKCAISDQDVDRDSYYPEYNEDNFRLTSIDFVGSNVFVYVDADEFPEGICATIFQKVKNTARSIESVYIIIE